MRNILQLTLFFCCFAHSAWSADDSSCGCAPFFNEHKNQKTVEKQSEKLRYAAYKGDLNRVKKALEKGADLNSPQDGHNAGATALYWAAKHGYMQIVTFLLAIPEIDKNAVQEKDNETPIMAAAEAGHWKIVELLLDRGADPTIATFGPLHFRHTLKDILDDALAKGEPPEYLVNLAQNLRSAISARLQLKRVESEP